ncbi:response regulator transcription factor [Tabrizicola fusiformis]|jgi:two-component system OmpR family response regulator|uniref:response regulator transcription factor n=1 Tax=Tabrizicola sp. SY72 TaxID=2741673 RepID=UPI001573A744|nr:response regulator transcription factor [Tabrizicola sp. SY72]NTT84700.1 response regulator transcription factor [Tabrizicola sp. SY72]
MDRILIVEDDPETAEAVAQEVRALGCEPVWLATLDEGVAASSQDFRVIVLDRMLPGGDGVEAMARIRAGGSRAMILVLSALGRAAQRVEGLEKGADDYLPKPFEPEELRARLRALLRRGTIEVLDNDLLAFGDLEIRLKARTVHVRRAHVAVSPKEFELITYFARNAGQVVTRMQLLENVWKLHFDPGTNVVDVHVGRLRRKLEEAGSAAIQTARGEGYVFAPLKAG